MQIELRARSTMVNSVPASGFDFHAAPGAKINVGTVADWKESRKYMQVVADGVHSYLPLPGGDLPEEPRFLPDVMTGGSVAFLVPADAKSLELRCDFPNAALPDGTVIRGVPLTFAHRGNAARARAAPSLAGAKDEIFDVSIIAAKRGIAVRRKNADEGKKFYVIDVLVKNLGKQQEFFQPKEQLKYADAKGGTSDWDDATLSGTLLPVRADVHSAGRAAGVSDRVPDCRRRDTARIAYSAVTEGASKVLTLPPLPAQVAAAPAPPRPSAAPPATPRRSPASIGDAAAPPR